MFPKKFEPRDLGSFKIRSRLFTVVSFVYFVHFAAKISP
jgi:hypothetical protein